MLAATQTGQSQQFSLAPLDEAAEYLRTSLPALLPVYLLAMVPHALASAWLIDAICAEQRDRAARCCAVLTLAMIWRWIGLAFVQRRVQRDLTLQPGGPIWRRLPAIVVMRLLALVYMIWGSIVILIPTFQGFFIGSFAAPLMLEVDKPESGRARAAMSWIRHSQSRLLKILLALIILAGWVDIAIHAIQYFLIEMVLPTLAGMDTSDMRLTTGGWAWSLGIDYLVFLILDFYWAVAAVFVYYQSQSHRLATDLKAQMVLLAEPAE
jgi:hypothetical protein